MDGNETGSEQTVCVIGGGLLGLFSALTLQEQGKQVHLIEREEVGGRQGASFGNGCWINPGAIMPISVPGLWREVPGYLIDPDGPFTVRWKYLPSLVGWLLRFIWAGRNWKNIEEQIKQRLPLLDNAVAEYKLRANQAGVEHLIRSNGTMYIYRDRNELEADNRAWELRRRHNIRVRLIKTDELRQLEPALSSDYRYGMMIEDAAILVDPSAYCRALGKLFTARGGRIVQAEVKGFDLDGNRLTGLKTDKGRLACMQAVIAAGAWSGILATKLGDRIPLISERGYHMTISDPGFSVNRGIMHANGKMAIVPTSTGLRLAGQVELASLAAPPRWKRAHILLGYAKRAFPLLDHRIEQSEHDMWLGHRPSTPDSLPVIDRSSACPDIAYAFGHGHTGVSMAPATARMIGRLLSARQLNDPVVQPFSAKRF